MRIPAIISRPVGFVWRVLKIIVRNVLLLTLPFSAFTILLALIQGFSLGKWFHKYLVEQPHLLADNMITIEAYEWLKDPYGENPLYCPRAPYHIKQLHNPLTWTQDIGISRPEDWKTTNVEVLVNFNALYRRRSRYSPEWHHWIYLSANEEPLNETWNEDPWDKAFLELLQHRDEHEPDERWNFNYITCPQSFLCSIWRVDGPALLHFTNELLEQDATQKQSRAPILDPVHVRVFDLPLNESVIPGRFPTRFEQMRSLTASNSTYWMKKERYSVADRIHRQASKVLADLKDNYPKTYGMLKKVEHKWTKLTGADVTTLIHYSHVGGSIAGFFSGRSVAVCQEKFQIWWRRYKYRQSPEGKENKPLGPDPVAQQLQGFLDTMSDEDKEAWSKTDRGGVILDRVQKGLEKKDWDGRDDIVAAIGDALGA